MFGNKFIVRADKNNSLRLVLTQNRKRVQISMGIKLPQETLDNALSSKPRPENLKWRSVLSRFQEVIDNVKCDLLREGNIDEDLSVIKKKVESALFHPEEKLEPEQNDSDSFYLFYKKQAELKHNAGYKESCLYTLKKLEEKVKNPQQLKFEDITLRWLYEFDEWLISTGASKNTRNIHFKNIRTVLNRAIDEELTTNYPFRRFKIRPEATRKRSLPVEELRKLFDCEVEEYQEFCRDMFKLIFFLCGINAVDLYNLKSITPDGRVEYRRAKTKRLYSIKVEPEAMEIIQKYKGEKNLLCIADRWKNGHKDFTKWLNTALKKIGRVRRVGRGGKKEIEAFWPEISSYWARHSWATIAYNDLDISKDVIAQGLGHGEDTVTDVYLDKDRRKVDAANRRVMDWVLYGKR